MKTNQSNLVKRIAFGKVVAGFCQSRRHWAIAIIFMASVWPSGPAAANLVDVTLNSAGPLAQGGEYVGPYNFTVASQFTKLVCDDYIDRISYGETWKANVYTFNDLSQTKYTAAGLQSYGQAAWLYEEGLLHPDAWGDIHYALWAVFNPTAVIGSAGWTAGSANWLATAKQQTYTANEFPSISIYTPTQLDGSGAPQELIGGTGTPPSGAGVAAVPEPNIGLMLGLGLLGVGVVRRYQNRSVAG